MVSWGWLLDVRGGGNCTGGIGGLSQCAGATGAVRITFVGLGGVGLVVSPPWRLTLKRVSSRRFAPRFGRANSDRPGLRRKRFA